MDGIGFSGNNAFSVFWANAIKRIEWGLRRFVLDRGFNGNVGVGDSCGGKILRQQGK